MLMYSLPKSSCGNVLVQTIVIGSFYFLKGLPTLFRLLHSLVYSYLLVVFNSSSTFNNPSSSPCFEMMTCLFWRCTTFLLFVVLPSPFRHFSGTTISIASQCHKPLIIAETAATTT